MFPIVMTKERFKLFKTLKNFNFQELFVYAGRIKYITRFSFLLK